MRKEVGNTTPLESISYYEKFFVAIEWDATKLGSTIKEGNYYDFSIGNKLQLNLMGNPMMIPLAAPGGKVIANASSRSEERRVGKECRSRWSPYH